MAQKNTIAPALGVGAALAAGAAAAGGAYWLFGAKHSAKHRKMAKSWMLKARAEVMEAIENLQDLDRESYMKVVTGVLDTYAKKAGTTPGEVAVMLRDFKSAWKHIQKAGKPAKRGTKRVTKAAKKATRRGKRKTSR